MKSNNFNMFPAIFVLAGIVVAAQLLGPQAVRAGSKVDKNLVNGLRTIDPVDIRRTVETLSSDAFEGREPGSAGETSTLDYLARSFRNIGLAPGNPDGTYLQKVPLTGYQSLPQASIGGEALVSPDEIVARSYRRVPEFSIENSDLVFVGYGVVAPEYGWDDFKGADLQGKTLVMLVNDPPIPDPNDPSKLDDKMFKGKAMTNYGRWTYKYEIARKMGAVGALIIHETGPAAYPYSVVVSSSSRENFDIHSEAPTEDIPDVAGWLPEARARTLLRSAGFDLDNLKQAALSRDFHPIPLNKKASFLVKQSWRDIESYNVLGKIQGSDPQLKNEVLVISAHWDHVGWDKTLPGTKSDQVFHGARDNAVGIATLEALAKAFKALPTPPKRTVLFLATTAEEKGLLGAQYYARHPLYPVKKTIADINIDAAFAINVFGRTRDVGVIGAGLSSLEDVLAAEAATEGRVIQPDKRPEYGYFFRADQLEFARIGVPVLCIGQGEDGLDNAADLTAKLEDYVANRYHRPADIITPAWDFSSAADDISLLFRVAYDVAQDRDTPKWKDGAEYAAIRDKSNMN